MWLSMLSVWGSLLTLVASQSCLDPSENSAPWVRLKPLGQCKDGESTCPYRITLPPLTVQLPKSFRELEKMARELRSLTQMVNQLKEDCRECKLRQGLDWNVRRDDEGEDGERIQASRGTLNTRERQQDISKRKSTVQVTTSRSAVEDTMIISSDAKDVNPTAFGKQMNTNQERNVNPRTTKPRAETNRGPKGFKTSEKNPISRSMSKVGEVPSLTTTKKKILQSPLDKLTESTFPGDLDSEQPTQHEKHKTNTMKVGHEVYPSGTLTAKGKIESTSQTTVTKPRLEKPGGSSGQDRILDTVNNIGRDSQPPVVEQTKGTNRRTGKTPFRTSSVDSNQENHKKPLREGRIQTPVGKMPLAVVSSERNELNYPTTAATPYTVKTEFKNNHSKMPQFTPPIIKTPHFMDQDRAEQAKTTSGVKVSNKHVHHRLENPSQEMESKRSHSDTGNKELQSASNGQRSGEVTDLQPNSLDSIQNRATGSMAIVMDIVKASIGSKVSTTSTESTNENRARDTNPVVMDKVEASTEANRLTPSSDDAPVPYNRYSKTPLGPADSVEGNNGGHSVDNNNGNSYPVAVNRMSGATLHKSPAGHTKNGNNKKPLTVNNMDDRHGLEKQLLSKCDGQCDLGPTPQSILNSRESSNDDRDKTSQDCSDFIMRNPTSGIYNVTPTGSDNRTFPVFCDMKSSGGGWTLIQHRFDGSISFNRTWNDYKRGFGNLTGEFWLGNDKIHWLTTTKPMVLRIELEDLDGMKEYAQYNHFHVANESQYYRLTIEGYSGTAGDAMQYSKKFNHNQKNFTTPDRDNDQYTSGNCGAYYSSGWWFDACLAANLNGKYYETRYRGVRNGIFWGTWHNISTESYLTHDRQSFKTVRMMIRPRTMLLMN
ncbi:hypothetical protein PGIGA_G00237170 [Pangasianodon gigas]|uniref:Uncharacterized protein n=1 Tax=Pangasianodon gigas TaxID=30993 RepID=A0ACC5WNH5_PANGG|nr:hypothetical protein [Pangasianodon gigas]